ncbi:hypothetical protein U1Q18_050960, partial [Sarracenia purpurea var. burkii]
DDDEEERDDEDGDGEEFLLLSGGDGGSIDLVGGVWEINRHFVYVYWVVLGVCDQWRELIKREESK